MASGPTPEGGLGRAAACTLLPATLPETASLRPTDERRGPAAILAATVGLLIALAYMAGQLVLGPWRAVVEAFDLAAAAGVQKLHSSWLDPPMFALSWVGEPLPTGIAAALLFAGLLLRRRWAAAVRVATMLAGVGAMTVTGRLVQRPRPNVVTVHDPTDYGFPSGHVILAVVLAALCLQALWPLLASRRQRLAGVALGIGFILAIALCRVYTGAHFASDTLAGLAMGLAWTTVALRMIDGPRRAPAADRASEPRAPARTARRAQRRPAALRRRAPLFLLLLHLLPLAASPVRADPALPAAPASSTSTGCGRPAAPSP